MLNVNVTKSDHVKKKLVWQSIDWKKTNKQVNNLRKRIYRASINGDMKKVRNLQKLMIRSRSNRLIAIRRVTKVNQGRKTPGVDKIIVNTDRDRNLLMDSLAKEDFTSVRPIRRIYIPKKNGSTRPLGIPTILDRCRQAVVKSALEPYWEAKFEGSSYGFRPGRSAQDAIQKIFCIARPGKSRKWILDADIEGAFDNIDHNFLMRTIGNFPGRRWIQAWLEAGVMEKHRLIPTTAGTPQGGIISPLLSNITLHDMGTALKISYDKLERIEQKSEYAFVRYADDFVVFAKSKESCLKAKEILEPWLLKRGLKLSEKKTSIRSIEEGFDFLGFNIRHYKTLSKRKGIVILCKPSKESIKSFKKMMTLEWKKSLSWTTERIIENLNPKIKGWCNYFKSGASKETFKHLGDWIWKRQERFVCRKHPNKSWKWRKAKYWGRIRGRNDRWVFMDKTKDKELYLWKPMWTPIKRHILVKGRSSPDDPELRDYWHKRQTYNSKYLFKTRSILWRKQEGKCLVCMDNIDNEESVHLHHKLPKKLGGKDQIDNLVLLHENCHQQVHSRRGQELIEVRKLLEPYAG